MAVDPAATGEACKALPFRTQDATATDTQGTEPFENGYHFPPKPRTWGESLKLGFFAFLSFFWTPLGFFVVIYGLLVVAWGGMLFLLLCNASPAMCYPTCDDINSPRRIWIEIDSQVVNALFCVIGFGLIPWRVRDLYYLLQYRVLGRIDGLRHLGGIHRGWFRLPGSEQLPAELGPKNIDVWHESESESSIPLPMAKIPDAPPTGRRAPATALWRIDFVVWMSIGNTSLQAVLSGLMWGLNRYVRPSWSVGLFVGLACVVGALAGVMAYIEGQRVKKIEGVPLTERDLAQLARDREQGIVHYNNLADKKPKAK